MVFTDNLQSNTSLPVLSSEFCTDSFNTININNKKVRKEDEYIEVDFVLNIHNIENIVSNLKKYDIFDNDTLHEYITMFINLMKSLKSQKKVETKSISDTNLERRSKKVGTFLYIKDELIHCVTNNNTLSDNKKKLLSWSILKKKLLKNEMNEDGNQLTFNKLGSYKEVFKSYSDLSISSLDIDKKEKLLKCWPSDYHSLLLYVKGEMKILFDINKDYNELLRIIKIFKSKKESHKKNANAYKILIPLSIKNQYFGTSYKKAQLSLVYDKLGFSQQTTENIKNFIKYDKLTENTRYHLSKLELLFHQYELRIIRLFIKLNVMQKELLESRSKIHII
uniref:PRESAN domain-containing protein n=1 Tax=Strongyloides papillosus TaxID=174720 RepID=A0A0N5BW86_STREA